MRELAGEDSWPGKGSKGQWLVWERERGQSLLYWGVSEPVELLLQLPSEPPTVPGSRLAVVLQRGRGAWCGAWAQVCHQGVAP